VELLSTYTLRFVKHIVMAANGVTWKIYEQITIKEQ